MFTLVKKKVQRMGGMNTVKRFEEDIHQNTKPYSLYDCSKKRIFSKILRMKTKM